MKKALVTGALGQDGFYLCSHLISLGYQVFGLQRRWPDTAVKNIAEGVVYLYGDMGDPQSLDVALRKSMPDEVYNLAGQTNVPTSWENPRETFAINASGFLSLMQYVRKICPEAHVYQASTSEMFGNTGGFLDESAAMNPTSPYGIAKYAAHKTARMYREMGLYVCSGICFNHESPKRGQEMVTRKITQAVASWKLPKELRRPLKLGNMAAYRDWGFAGDYVKAMHLMLQQKDPDDYVIATGESHSVQEFWLAAVRAIDMDPEEAMLLTLLDANLKRANDTMYLWGNAAKAHMRLGWYPSVTFKNLVKMMVDSDYQQLLERPI